MPANRIVVAFFFSIIVLSAYSLIYKEEKSSVQFREMVASSSGNQQVSGGVRFYNNSPTSISQPEVIVSNDTTSGTNNQNDDGQGDEFIYEPPLSGKGTEMVLLDLRMPSYSELTVDPRGAGSFSEYARHILENTKNVAFDLSKLAPLVQDGDASDLIPSRFISMALQSSTSSVTRQNAEVLKGLMEASAAYRLSVKVHGKGVEINRLYIGLDYLDADALQRLQDFLDGKTKKDDFQVYYERYIATLQNYTQDILQLAGVPAEASDSFASFVKNISVTLGFNKIANAIEGLGGFGGTILLADICFCPPQVGGAVSVGPPNKAIVFFTPFITKLNLTFKPIPGFSVLGTSIPSPGPCLKGIPPAVCAPSGPVPAFESTALIIGN